MTLKNIVAKDGTIVMLHHVVSIESMVFENPSGFWSRITAKMIDSSSIFLFTQSYAHKTDRDNNHAKALRMIASMFAEPSADFSKPLRARKR